MVSGARANVMAGALTSLPRLRRRPGLVAFGARGAWQVGYWQEDKFDRWEKDGFDVLEYSLVYAGGRLSRYAAYAWISRWRRDMP